jgi:hypothetical protein
VATAAQECAEILGDVSAAEVDPLAGVLEAVALVDGDDMGDPVSAIQHHASGLASSEQGEDALGCHEEGRHVVGPEEVLAHGQPVRLGVEVGLRQQDRVLL